MWFSDISVVTHSLSITVFLFSGIWQFSDGTKSISVTSIFFLEFSWIFFDTVNVTSCFVSWLTCFGVSWYGTFSLVSVGHFSIVRLFSIFWVSADIALFTSVSETPTENSREALRNDSFSRFLWTSPFDWGFRLWALCTFSYSSVLCMFSLDFAICLISSTFTNDEDLCCKSSLILRGKSSSGFDSILNELSELPSAKLLDAAISFLSSNSFVKSPFLLFVFFSFLIVSSSLR